MKRTVGTILAAIIILTSLTGCWSRRELNEIAITVALAIDKQEEKYKISAQIVNPGEVASTKGGVGLGVPTQVYSETADTVFEAIRKLTTVSPRKIYVSHLRMLVIGEDVAKEGIGKFLDFISRGHEFRTDFFIVVAKGEPAEDMLRTYTIPQEVIPANKMYKSLETAQKTWAAIGKTTLDELTTDILSEGKDPVLTGIIHTGAKGGTPSVESRDNVDRIKMISSLQFEGMAAFKKDKMVGWLNEKEATGLNYILGNVKSTVSPISCGKGKIVLEVVRSETKVEGKVVHGRPEIDVGVRTEENVAEVECKIDLLKPETISELEAKAEQSIKDAMKKALDKAQKEYKADIFGFGEAIHRSDPKAWNQLKEDWSEIFADVPVHLDADVKIRHLGTATEPFSVVKE